jgi:hypothetical protein
MYIPYCHQVICIIVHQADDAVGEGIHQIKLEDTNIEV